MPRKLSLRTRIVTVLVSGGPVQITLHPPTGARSSWYVYWSGLTFSKSTGCRDVADAIVQAEHMVRNHGRRATVLATTLTDDEFEEVQRSHFSKTTDPDARVRAMKTQKDCLESIRAFREITRAWRGNSPMASATPADCERFQRESLKLPADWRCRRERQAELRRLIGPNTVLKWSRQLQAAFERVNRSAGRKCVRGVVDDAKLLKENPWHQFRWIGGTKRPLRQFDARELVSFLDYLEQKWPGVSVAAAFAMVSLWSWGRREELSHLRWTSFRKVGNEHFFETTGKRGVEKWFRIPEGLCQKLQSIRTNSDFVFAAYVQQVRTFHESCGNVGLVKLVAIDFKPVAFGQWFYKRVREWSATLTKGRAYPHVFRKTSMQYARRGEDISRELAEDIRVSPSVMMSNYVKETDEEMRAKGNRVFRRILASLPPEVAARYGHVSPSALESQVKAALAAGDWQEVARLSSELAVQKPAAAS
jgi:integrase